MSNLLTDAPSNDPDAPDDELPNAETMSITDLKHWDAHYMRLMLGHTPLTAAQDEHWGHLSEQIAFRNDARRWTYQRPIRDVACWYCGQPFETRDPAQGLCPPCERLADEDTRVTRF